MSTRLTVTYDAPPAWPQRSQWPPFQPAAPEACHEGRPRP